MASNIYYGICTTAGNEQNKQVRLANVSSESEGLHLQKGDILSVYFVHKNEANGVTLTLSIGDINQEYNTSVSVDESGFNTSIIGVAPGAWTDGEVVNFSYTHNGSVVENADNSYYWEMVGKPIATSNTYGDVILDGQDLATAASQNKVNALIDARGVKELSYEDVSTGETTIGRLRLNTRYSNDNISSQEPPIVITIPNIPKDTGDLTNDAGYIKNAIGSNLTFTGNSKQIKVNNNGDTTIIDLCDNSTSDTIINSLGNINLNPTGNLNGNPAGHVNITLPTNESQLNVLNGNGIACNKLNINGENNRLIVDTISSHSPSPNLITFESPVNIPNGPNTINGLQTDGITITSGSEPRDLDDYLVDVLGENDAKAVLNSWLADQLDGYLYTRRYHAKTGGISAGGEYMLMFGFGENEAPYTYTDGHGESQQSTTGNLKITGYDIVGIITWETYGTNCRYANICSIYWDNNDPSTGKLKLRVASSEQIDSRIGMSVSFDVLYKKQLHTS